MKLINKIVKRLERLWLGYGDKILHFVFGYFVASQFQVTGYYMVLPAVAIGTLKEYYDIKKNNYPLNTRTLLNAEWACTAAGGFYALFVYAVSLLGGVHLPSFITMIIK